MECELPLFYSHWEVTARKSHTCCECIAPINPGERHFVASGMWPDGDKPKRFRQHLLCEKACEYVRDYFNDDCIGFGQLFEWIGSEAYNLKEFKNSEKGKTFRKMIADIKRRERNS